MAAQAGQCWTTLSTSKNAWPKGGGRFQAAPLSILTHLQVLLEEALTWNQLVIFLPALGLLAELGTPHPGQPPLLLPGLQLAARRRREMRGWRLGETPCIGRSPQKGAKRLPSCSPSGSMAYIGLPPAQTHGIRNSWTLLTTCFPTMMMKSCWASSIRHPPGPHCRVRGSKGGLGGSLKSWG